MLIRRSSVDLRLNNGVMRPIMFSMKMMFDTPLKKCGVRECTSDTQGKELMKCSWCVVYLLHTRVVCTSYGPVSPTSLTDARRLSTYVLPTSL
jgi:hypothetical protein